MKIFRIKILLKNLKIGYPKKCIPKINHKKFTQNILPQKKKSSYKHFPQKMSHYKILQKNEKKNP